MSTDNFFNETTPQSTVKAMIVENYFSAWARIMVGTQNRPGYRAKKKIGYVDLFAGPGRYKSGAVSTPLRVLQMALTEPELCERLLTIFNDKDDENVHTLEQEIDAIEGIDRLAHKPQVWNQEVGDKIAADFESINTVPLLAFVDPWGYRGLTLRLVNAFLKSWGCDCIFFFNYSRINAGLSNPYVKEHMAALFGEERAKRLATELAPMAPAAREATIVNELALALQEHSAGNQRRYVLPFCFKTASGRRTSHHLVLVTKSFKGYEVMKDIMAKASSSNHDDVPSFTYSPATGPEQMLLFRLNSPLNALRGSLMTDLAGRTMTMRDIYKEHSVDTPYLARNYKKVLRDLEDEGVILTKGRRSNRGFADNIVVSFPPRNMGA
ncbi:MAG: three-Cys-motif partner protein TcmP [Bradymonadia bacterium]